MNKNRIEGVAEQGEKPQAYFRLSQTPKVWRTLDEWMRHRLRTIQLKDWKPGKTMYRELKALGASEMVACRVPETPVAIDEMLIGY